MNSEELNKELNKILNSNEVKIWLNSFPINLKNFTGNEKDKDTLCKLLAYSISNSVEMKCLFLNVE